MVAVPLSRVAAAVIDAIRVEARGPSHGPVYHVAIEEQELRQVKPILSGEYRDERFLEHFFCGSSNRSPVLELPPAFGPERAGLHAGEEAVDSHPKATFPGRLT
jgi:hypothetical protein